jgi:hypothetical protein
LVITGAVAAGAAAEAAQQQRVGGSARDAAATVAAQTCLQDVECVQLGSARDDRFGAAGEAADRFAGVTVAVDGGYAGCVLAFRVDVPRRRQPGIGGSADRGGQDGGGELGAAGIAQPFVVEHGADGVEGVPRDDHFEHGAHQRRRRLHGVQAPVLGDLVAVWRFAAKPLTPSPLGFLGRLDPHTHGLRLCASEFREQGDDHPGLRLGGVQPILHRHQPPADAFQLVEQRPDLPDAAAGQTVQFPDDQRSHVAAGDGIERGGEAVAVCLLALAVSGHASIDVHPADG